MSNPTDDDVLAVLRKYWPSDREVIEQATTLQEAEKLLNRRLTPGDAAQRIGHARELAGQNASPDAKGSIVDQ